MNKHTMAEFNVFAPSQQTLDIERAIQAADTVALEIHNDRVMEEARLKREARNARRRELYALNRAVQFAARERARERHRAFYDDCDCTPNNRFGRY